MELSYFINQSLIGILLGLTIPYIIKYLIWLFNRYAKFTKERDKYAKKCLQDKIFNKSPVKSMCKRYRERYAFFTLMGIKNSTPTSREFIETALERELIDEDEAKYVHNALIFFEGKFVCVSWYFTYFSSLILFLITVGFRFFLFNVVFHSHVPLIEIKIYGIFFILIMALITWNVVRDFGLLRISKKLSLLSSYNLTLRGKLKLMCFFKPDLKKDLDFVDKNK